MGPETSFRMPAEWEPHAATWVAWPHKRESWPGKFEPIPAVWAQMVKALAPGEEVRILVNDEAMERAARAELKRAAADAPSVLFHRIPTDDAWIRDHGPIFVKTPEGRMVALDWLFTSWGGKYPPFDLDDATPQHVARALGVPCTRVDTVLEGGSIDVNGAGLLLTTEQCLLNPNRNPHLSRGEIERQLCRWLGARRVLWLGEGIEGDDTDGHVDDLARFVAPDTVVTIVERDETDFNHRPLRENRERLDSFTDLEGRRLRVIELPTPRPVFHAETRLPASYANFYIGNAAILVPTYDSPREDAEAIEILRSCFPGREVVGLRAVDMVWGLGAFHCATQQQPCAHPPATELREDEVNRTRPQ
jgi:agmatine deiminase